MKKILFPVAFCLIAGSTFAVSAFAAPQVESVTFLDNDRTTLVIRGNGFGVHPDFSPGNGDFLAAGWHNFENGSLQGGNVYRDSISPKQWSVEAVTARPGSQYYAKKVFIDDERGELYVPQSGTTGVWYSSFWMRLQTPSEQQSGKFFRVYGGNSNIYLSVGSMHGFGIRGYSECGSCSPSPSTVWGSPQQLKANTWHRIEIEMSQNPDWFAVYVDGSLQWRRSSTLSGEERQKWVPNPFGGNGHTFGIGQMLDAPDRGWPANGSYKFDEFYVSYTKARIELSHASTWKNALRKELQIPIEWTGDQIKARFQQSTLEDGQIYLYVIDANGIANENGVPLQMDGLALPRPPDEVSVN